MRTHFIAVVKMVQQLKNLFKLFLIFSFSDIFVENLFGDK